MQVITVINDTKNFGFNLLRLSCAINNLELVVLVAEREFDSNRIKDDLLKAYLEELDDNEIVLFTDGIDAIFMCTEMEILSKFHHFNKDLVFSAEAGCWPDTKLAGLYPDVQSPYKYLNSGGFIGKVHLVKKLLNDETIDVDDFKASNQYVWSKTYLKNQNLIALDIECEIFCTFSPQIGNDSCTDAEEGFYSYMDEWFKSNFFIKNHRINNKITNTQPCQAHFNGYSKWLMYQHVPNMLYSKIPTYKPVQLYYETDN